MIIELISTGTELLLGEIINTNAPYLARRLNELGFNGIMNLETCYPIFFGEELEAEAGAFALKIAKKLADMVEN